MCFIMEPWGHEAHRITCSRSLPQRRCWVNACFFVLLCLSPTIMHQSPLATSGGSGTAAVPRPRLWYGAGTALVRLLWYGSGTSTRRLLIHSSMCDLWRFASLRSSAKLWSRFMRWRMTLLPPPARNSAYSSAVTYTRPAVRVPVRGPQNAGIDTLSVVDPCPLMSHLTLTVCNRLVQALLL